LHKDCFVVLQSVFVENSFSFVYTITAKNGTIDERPTTNIPVVDETILTNEDFWWLIGYLQGDGCVDPRNGIWFHSTDPELIQTAKSVVTDLFSLASSTYLETPPPPWKPTLRLAVYSRPLVKWLSKQHLRFGTQRWNVPVLSKDLFCSYIAGLFDAEGQVVLTRNKRLSRFVIHSANGLSLRTIAQRMSEFGVDCLLRTRVRDGKPSVHYQLEIVRRGNLRWFVRNIGKRSRLHRKNCYLREELLQKIPARGSRPNSKSPKGENPAVLIPPQ